MDEERGLVSDVFGLPLNRAEEIIEDIHIALYEDPTVINEHIFIEYLRDKYKDKEREFALYIGARVSERLAKPHGLLEKLLGA